MALVSPAYYVSPTGNDTTGAGTFGSPWATLEKAQTAMKAGSTKTTYLLGGTYNRAASLSLGSGDGGESWLGYPGQTPVLDGGGTLQWAFVLNSAAPNVTIRFLTIQNFYEGGLSVSGASNAWIDSNTIQNITVNTALNSGFNQAAIQTSNGGTNNRFTQNLVLTTQGDGINITTNSSNNISGTTISGNVVSGTCAAVADCGAIHFNDRAGTVGNQSTGISITGNIVINPGPNTAGGEGIYADDFGSNAAITGNIVYGTGHYAYQVHGGLNLVVSNNIFDLTGMGNLGLYQGETSGGYTGPMTGNTFACNIVYSTHPPTLDATLWHTSSPAALPSVANNLYYDTTGSLPNTGTIVDASPTVANPGFVNAAANSYGFTAGNPPSFGCAFTPINAGAAGPLANAASSMWLTL